MPESNRPEGKRTGAFLILFLIAYNNVVNFLPSGLHARVYVALNLACLAGLLLYGRRVLDLSFREMGWSGRGLVPSLLWGAAFTALVIAAFLVCLRLLPLTGLNIGRPRLEGVTAAGLWSRVLFRIPLGTALFEEALFRGLGWGYLERRSGPSRALLVTSLLFAAWHIVPAYEVVMDNFHMGFGALAAVYWVVGLAGAFCAGVFFGLIRKRTGSVGGCLLAHYLINSLALLLIYYCWR